MAGCVYARANCLCVESCLRRKKSMKEKSRHKKCWKNAKDGKPEVKRRKKQEWHPKPTGFDSTHRAKLFWWFLVGLVSVLRSQIFSRILPPKKFHQKCFLCCANAISILDENWISWPNYGKSQLFVMGNLKFSLNVESSHIANFHLLHVYQLDFIGLTKIYAMVAWKMELCNTFLYFSGVEWTAQKSIWTRAFEQTRWRIWFFGCKAKTEWLNSERIGKCRFH